jgi:hypothetical protein
MEKRHKITSHRIDACKVWAFPEIAAVAGQGKVFHGIGPTVLSGEVVLHMMS